jgi:hypothetical protein
MPTVTGTLADFNLQALTGLRPKIIFRPNRSALSPTRLYVARPIEVTPADDGSFSVELVPTQLLEPAAWYTIEIRWQEPSGRELGRDYPDWRVFVTAEGGTLSGLISTPADNTLLVAWQPNQPDPWPSGLVWVNTITGDVVRKD